MRSIAIAPAFNEEQKIGQVVARTPRNVVDCVLVVDDGSTDRTAEVARCRRRGSSLAAGSVGVGSACGPAWTTLADEGFDIAVIMAGNNKDNPAEIPRLLDPIRNDGCDLVVGSRFLSAGGAYGGDMPAYRKLATRLHPWLMSRITGKRSDGNDQRLPRHSPLVPRRPAHPARPALARRLRPGSLSALQADRLRFSHTEVPCTKIYPPKKIGNTKMRPIIGWWDILRPVFLLGTGLKS